MNKRENMCILYTLCIACIKKCENRIATITFSNILYVVTLTSLKNIYTFAELYLNINKNIECLINAQEY